MADLSNMSIILCPCCKTENRVGTDLCQCGEFIADIKPTDPHLEENIPPQQSSDPLQTTEKKSESEAPLMCCNMPIPPGEKCCPLCGETVSLNFTVEWPWGDSSLIEDRLFIGRVPPANEELAMQLETNHLNISRMHAEIFIDEGKLILRDLGSSNGTFIENQRIKAFQQETLNSDSCIRFASDFEISIKKA